METLRNYEKEMLSIKNTATEMENAFKRLIHIDTAEAGFSEFEGRPIETSQNGMQRVKRFF